MKAYLAMLVIALMASGCTTRTLAPVTDRMPAPIRAPVVASAPAVAPPAAPIAPLAAAAAPELDAEGRPLTYAVKRGDTLGRIALDHGVGLRELAAWNYLENPNLLRVGQVLRLRPPPEAEPVGAGPQAADGSVVVTAPVRPPPLIAEVPLAAVAKPTPAAGPQAAPSSAPRSGPEVWKAEPKGVRLPYSEQAVAQLQRSAGVPIAQATGAGADRAVPATARVAPAIPPTPAAPVAVAPAPEIVVAPRPATPAASPAAPAAPPATPAAPPAAPPAPDSDDIDWIWPATGKLIANFSDGGSAKGIDIAGRLGQPVVAGADGRVVYAGSGLRGYGKLIIIKHNKTYLSAYAHNNQILVKEGQQVTRGQKIAEMGSSDADQVKLHFEIRRMGKPVDPAKYLPPG